MTSSISLNCSILGPDVTASFIVEVSLDASVGKLKQLIKKEVETGRSAILHNLFVIVNTSRTYLQPPTPFFEFTIGDQLKGVINGGSITGTEKLRGTMLLSSYFSGPSVPGTVDLVVQLPLTGEYQPLSLAAFICPCALLPVANISPTHTLPGTTISPSNSGGLGALGEPNM